MISFSCPSCSTKFRVADDKAGKRSACRKCQALLTVPEPPDGDTVVELALPISYLDQSNSVSEKVGVLCENCFRVFEAKPSCVVRCLYCDNPCTTASLEEAARAVEEAKSGQF